MVDGCVLQGGEDRETGHEGRVTSCPVERANGTCMCVCMCVCVLQHTWHMCVCVCV